MDETMSAKTNDIITGETNETPATQSLDALLTRQAQEPQVAFELEMQLCEAKRALDDKAAVVFIVPRPDRYGYMKPDAFAIGDVSRICRS